MPMKIWKDWRVRFLTACINLESFGKALETLYKVSLCAVKYYYNKKAIGTITETKVKYSPTAGHELKVKSTATARRHLSKYLPKSQRKDSST